jgi:flagellar basal body-associated protein FliL
MSKTTTIIIVVLVIVGLGIWAYFWQSGKKAEEELRERAKALTTQQVAPAPQAPEETTPKSEKTAPEAPAPAGG